MHKGEVMEALARRRMKLAGPKDHFDLQIAQGQGSEAPEGAGAALQDMVNAKMQDADNTGLEMPSGHPDAAQDMQMIHAALSKDGDAHGLRGAAMKHHAEKKGDEHKKK